MGMSFFARHSLVLVSKRNSFIRSAVFSTVEIMVVRVGSRFSMNE
jgi:hypothetical protein